MRKTISNGINRRAVYKFQCTGPCNRMKFTYVYDRAKAGVCLSCSKNQVNHNQGILFPEASVELSEDEIILRDGYGNKTTLDVRSGTTRHDKEV